MEISLKEKDLRENEMADVAEKEVSSTELVQSAGKTC
jgi:hypothetical protein